MRCSASGSNRSASFVDSTRSQKRIVTIFRVSRSAGAARGAPQAAQKRASSPLAAPQREQVAIGQVYGGKRGAARGGARRDWRNVVRRTWCDARSEARTQGAPIADRYRCDRGRGLGASSVPRAAQPMFRQALLLIEHLFVEPLAAVEAARDLERLALGSRRRRV